MSSVCSAVVHATAWSYGCFAELKENTEGTTNSTKEHENFCGSPQKTRITLIIREPQNTPNTPKCLAAGLTIFYRLCLYIMNSEYRKVNSSGGSAVVVASRGGNSIMRKLYALEIIFSEKQENER